MKKTNQLETVPSNHRNLQGTNRRPDVELDHYLRSMIRTGRFPQGSKLPSLRDLAAEFKLSVATVQRCLVELQNEGLVERIHGAGVFVQVPRKTIFGSGERRIAVKLERNPAVFDTYCSYALLGAQERAAKHHCLLEIDYRTMPTRQALIEAAKDCDALLLMGANYEAAIQEGLDIAIPVVGVEFGDSHDGLCSMLSLDPFQAAGLAVRYYIERAVSQVTIIHSRYEIHRERAEAFLARWKHFGKMIELEFIERENIPADLDWKNGAFYFTGGDTYDFIAKRYAEETGDDMTLNRKILSLDGKARLVPGHLSGPCIFPDWREVGRAALDEVFRRLETPGATPRRIMLPCILE